LGSDAQANRSQTVVARQQAMSAGGGVGQRTAEKTQKPFDLSAHLVEALVTRAGGKNDLDKLRTEGKVHVRQEPATPEDRGVDIRGDTLRLTHSPNGNLLVVTGDLAQLQMDKIFIVGPEVNID